MVNVPQAKNPDYYKRYVYYYVEESVSQYQQMIITLAIRKNKLITCTMSLNQLYGKIN